MFTSGRSRRAEAEGVEGAGRAPAQALSLSRKVLRLIKLRCPAAKRVLSVALSGHYQADTMRADKFRAAREKSQQAALHRKEQEEVAKKHGAAVKTVEAMMAAEVARLKEEHVAEVRELTMLPF